jgi:hypothetical protein
MLQAIWSLSFIAMFVGILLLGELILYVFPGDNDE